MTSSQHIVIDPIGYVKTEAVGDEVKDRTRTSQIIVKNELTPALEGVGNYSHLYVLFWLNEVPKEKRMMLKVHPRGIMYLPLTGAFAVRTNLRPNPIGLTVVELISVQENVLTVKGLDAYNETPVIDIKPYDSWDVVENPKVPDWWKKLEKEKKLTCP